MKHWEQLSKEEQQSIIKQMVWDYNYRESLEFESNNFPLDLPKPTNHFVITSAQLKDIMEKDKV